MYVQVWLADPCSNISLQRHSSFKYCTIYIHYFHRDNLSLSFRVLGVVLVEIVLVLVAAPPRPVPKVERLAVYAIRRGDHLQQVAARDLDGGDLRRGETDEVRKQTADRRRVPDDQEVLALALQFD